MYKVSVIIPVYNVENYLTKCLESVVNQTLRDIQIIVVNDGSTDNTALIARKYHDLYPARFVYIEKENSGQGGARNVGLAYAAGEYIGFVDGDDYVEPDMYEQMYTRAKRDNLDMVECGYDHVCHEAITAIKKAHPYNAKNMLIKTKNCVYNKLIKRGVISGNDIQFPETLKYEDFEYSCKIVPYITSAASVHGVYYHYAQHSNSTMHSENPRVRDIFKVLDNIVTYYRTRGFYDKYKEQLEYVCIKELLAASFFRILKINDKEARAIILRENWDILQNMFPCWRYNRILKTLSLKNLFLKSMNKITYHIYAKILPSVIYCQESAERKIWRLQSMDSKIEKYTGIEDIFNDK